VSQNGYCKSLQSPGYNQLDMGTIACLDYCIQTNAACATPEIETLFPYASTILCLPTNTKCTDLPINSKVKAKLFFNRLCRSIGLRDVKDPKLYRQSAHKRRLGHQPYAPAALYPQKDLVLISVRRQVNPRGAVQLEGLGKLKILNYLIGTRTCDLPVCSIVSQPSMLLAPQYININDWKSNFN
jgi:hypothetical protein